MSQHSQLSRNHNHNDRQLIGKIDQISSIAWDTLTSITRHAHVLEQAQWPNDASRALGRSHRANFATLTARLAKVCVWFSNLAINLNFSATFS